MEGGGGRWRKAYVVWLEVRAGLMAVEARACGAQVRTPRQQGVRVFLSQGLRVAVRVGVRACNRNVSRTHAPRRAPTAPRACCTMRNCASVRTRPSTDAGVISQSGLGSKRPNSSPACTPVRGGEALKCHRQSVRG